MVSRNRPHARTKDRRSGRVRMVMLLGTSLASATTGAAQEPQPAPTGVHEHVAVTAPLLTPTKETSGTAWLPQVTPMYGVHRPWRGWDLRLSGVAFAQALYEPRDRHRTGGSGTRQVGSINWGMFMARRNAGGGRFGIRTMFSAEPWTVPGCGSLNFLATGEVCEGDTIHDRQQPHDLFMELAVDYDRRLGGAWRWQVYAGLAGEPALGPPGYPHRASAIANPIRPVTHHWLDSTHVTFGLVTVGVHNQRWKAETSVFNGREPDDSRADLDLGAFDSVARASFIPADRTPGLAGVSCAPAGGEDGLSPSLLRIPRPESLRPRCITGHWRGRHLGNDLGLWYESRARNRGRRPTGYHVRRGAAREQHDIFRTAYGIRQGRRWVECPRTIYTRTSTSMSVFAIGKVQLGYVRHLSAIRGVAAGNRRHGFHQPSASGARTALLRPLPHPSLGVFFSLQAARHQM